MADEPDEAAGAALAPGEPRSFGNGRYVVQRRLGAGNFATVYLAQDDRLDVKVAVKLLSDRWSWEPEVRGRFVQEARLLRSLNDPLVVQIRDIAETDDGRPYLVMDYATEGTLEQRMIELVQRQVHPTTQDLRVAVRALAAALSVLHERRIAHRDIKPSNLLITRFGPRGPNEPAASPTAILRPGERLMLGDLGLAKDLAFDSGVTVGVGTAGYMAPEQALAGGKIDVRTDLYAASALVAQLASGEAPDPVRRVSNGRLEGGSPLSPRIPPPLASSLLRGLDTDPDHRPQNVQEWLEGVEAGLVAAAAASVAAEPVGGGPVALLSGPVPPVASPLAAGPPAAAPTPAPFRPPPPSPTVRASPASPVPSPPAPPRASVAPTVAVPPPPYAAGTATAPPPPSRPPTGSAVPVGRNRRVVIIAAVVVLALVGIGLVVKSLGGSGNGASTTTTTIFSVHLTGPTEITRGVQAIWTVDSPNAISGTWALTGPLKPDPAEWSPGNYFQGTWTAVGTFRLTLTVVDAGGNKAEDSIEFTVS